MVDVFKQWRDKVDYMIHCGDSELSSDDELWKEIHVVAGNKIITGVVSTIDDLGRIVLTDGQIFSSGEVTKIRY